MTPDDRELLELAAKAAGIDCEIEVFSNGRTIGTNRYNEIIFDPLTDDGDALRLAVKLGISVSFSHSTGLDVPYPSINQVGAFSGWSPTYYEAHAEDWNAATRRAIVRAAADIGRNTK